MSLFPVETEKTVFRQMDHLIKSRYPLKVEMPSCKSKTKYVYRHTHIGIICNKANT